eukprot:gene5485-9303_t
MKLIVFIIACLFFSSFARYAVRNVYQISTGCSETLGGNFVEGNQCFLEPSGRSFGKWDCNSTHITVHSCKDKNCGSCTLFTTYKTNECSRDFQYLCEDKKPKIKPTGFYGRYFSDPQCSKPSVTNFAVYTIQKFCVNQGEKIFPLLTKKVIKSQSGGMYFDEKKNTVFQTFYAGPNCTGRKIFESKFKANHCERYDQGYIIFSDKDK